MEVFRISARQCMMRNANIFSTKYPATTKPWSVAAAMLIQTRNAGGFNPMHVNRDWRPKATFPQTPEEHVIRAHWYGMHPADYKVDTEDQGTYPTGDYPKLPIVSFDERDPYEPWDNWYEKHNFNEPVLRDWEAYNQLRISNVIFRNSPVYMMMMCWGVSALFFFVLYLSRNIEAWAPFMAKSWPNNDLWLERGLDPRQEPERPVYTWDLED